MIKKILIMTVIIALVLCIGCFSLKIESDVDYPVKLFKKTLRHIKKMGYNDHECPHVLHFLVYDGEDRKLISFTIPADSMEIEDLDEFIGQKDQKVEVFSQVKINIDWQKIEEDITIKRGLILNIRDYEENDHILIWAE